MAAVVDHQGARRGPGHRVHPIFVDLDGSSVDLHIHELVGVADGPTLTLLSGVHGSEWFSHEIVRAVLHTTDPQQLRGRLVGVPVANPYAFRTMSRYSADPQQVGYVNLNKAMLRPELSTTALIARALQHEVLENATHVVDFHPGPWGSAWHVVLYTSGGGSAPVARQMATAFGVPYITGADPLVSYPNSVAEVAFRAGIPIICPEVGGLGFGEDLEQLWLDQNIEGVRRVMIALGMLDGDVDERTPAEVEVTWDLRPSTSGLLVPAVGPDRLLGRVSAGELLGRLISPVDFAVLEEYRSPGDGVLLAVARRYPVHPHNFGFVVGTPH